MHVVQQESGGIKGRVVEQNVENGRLCPGPQPHSSHSPLLDALPVGLFTDPLTTEETRGKSGA